MEKQPSDAVERWILALSDPHRDVRSRAAYELGKLKDARAISPLILALGDEAKLVRSWAAGALGQIGAPAVEALLTVLPSADREAGYYAALALGDMGDVRAVPILVQAIQEGDWDIRFNAGRTLEVMGATTTLPHRILTETHLTALQRFETLNALSRVAYQDEQIELSNLLPDLTLFCQERLQDTDEGVAESARAVLAVLQNASPAPSPLPPSKPDEREQILEDGSETQKMEIAPSPTQTTAPNTFHPSGGKTKQSLWARMLKRDKG